MIAPLRSPWLKRWLAKQVIKTPYMADSITQGTLASIDKAPGSTVQADDTVATIETDKVNIPVNTPHAGRVVSFFAKVGDTVTVGSDLFELDTDASSAKSASKANEKALKEAEEKPKKTDVPKVTVKVPVDTAPKTGVKEADSVPLKSAENLSTMEAILPTPPATQSVPSNVSTNTVSTNTTSTNTVSTNSAGGTTRTERVEPLSRMRLRIAERMKEAQTSAASLTTFNEVDMTNLQRMRAEMKQDFVDKYGVRLGYMGAFVKACATALVEMPAVNGQIDVDAKTLTFRDYVDVSVAVATPKVRCMH